MHRLAIIAAITLGGCTQTEVVARSPGNVYVRHTQSAPTQEILDAATQACAPRIAYSRVVVLESAWTGAFRTSFECR